MHTTVSDGVWSPSELFAYIRKVSLEAFSISDHDTMDVYPLPEDLAVRCIPGMEVDTKCQGATTHLLVYGITSSDAPLLQHLRAQRAARRVRMEAMIESLRGRGFEITMAHVEAQAGKAVSLGRPHLARALVDIGAVSTVQEAFDKYIADGGDDYVSLDRLNSDQAIELAHASGAVVSVAHPCRLKDPRMLEQLRDEGADGIEVVHPSADADAMRQLTDFAQSNGLLITGGSDFHAPAPGYAPGIEFAAEHVERLKEAVERARTAPPVSS
ncbi:MAG TPA: PHP domain-containing protein [Candidatus Baltobacteraceae bacterium]|jgi:hypothetical protein|nr:PHP domain-containing protein [Candidatus Baltobacteraceae bacterium]